VCIDDRRVWTFWTRRDTTPAGAGRRPGAWPLRHVEWPAPLRRHLDGRARITVRDSADGTVLYDEDVVLGDGTGTIRVQNDVGVDLGIDKSGRLVPTFAGRSSGDIAALLDATEAVIEALRRAGVQPFLAYGTLLGAVREGEVLGHDSDADLGYVSSHSCPVDVARESFEVQRRLAAEGWEISRYSGASFKISVTEADVTRGLDVFGGFLDGGRLHLMGEIGTDFEREWLYPLGTAQLHGRPMPVPAQPEKLLEVTYGSRWRTPDPAFRFTTPERTIRAFNDWFRGTQVGSRFWARRANATAAKPLRRRPTSLGREALALARAMDAEVLDVGAGRGTDSLFLAEEGLRVIAYDYVLRGLDGARAIAARESIPLEVRPLNLTELRSVLAEGARLARDPRPRVVLARNVLDATSPVGRESLARLCSMALRSGGRLLAEFHPAEPGAGDERREWMVGRVDTDVFTRLLRDAGATAVQVRHGHRAGHRVVRVLGEW
jgi:SAM-dependent methyltransferase